MQQKHKTAIITGNWGFIGNHLTYRLLKEGWFVYGIDKFNYVSNNNQLLYFQENYPNQFKFFNDNITTIEWIPECDVIFNLAAESHVENSFKKSQNFVSSNIDGVRNLLELIQCTLSSADKPLFYQFSTDEVYGDIENGYFNEEDPLNPSNPYAATKAAADLLIKSWARTHGLEYLIVRPSNNYGIYQYPEKLIPVTVRKLQRNKLIKLHNRGKPIRTWTHVEDTINAVMILLEKADRNKIYNISSGFEQTNLQTVQKIINCYFMGKSSVNVPDYEKYLDLTTKRLGQDIRYAINCHHLIQYGWQPEKIFNNSIRDIVDFYKKEFIW